MSKIQTQRERIIPGVGFAFGEEEKKAEEKKEQDWERQRCNRRVSAHSFCRGSLPEGGRCQGKKSSYDQGSRMMSHAWAKLSWFPTSTVSGSSTSW